MSSTSLGTFPHNAAMQILLVPLGGISPEHFDGYCSLFESVTTLPLSGMTHPGRWSQKHSPFRHFDWFSSANGLQFRWIRFTAAQSSFSAIAGSASGGGGSGSGSGTSLDAPQADPWRDFQAHRRIYGAVGVLHFPSFAGAGLSEHHARAQMEAALVEFGCGHDGFNNVVWRICVFDQPFEQIPSSSSSSLSSSSSSNSLLW